MAVLAVRIRDATRAMLEIGNEADQYLVSRLAGLFTEIDPTTLALIEANAGYFAPVEIDARNEVLASLSGAIDGPGQLVSSKLRQLCTSFSKDGPLPAPSMAAEKHRQ
ncbi:hypothetical protein G8O24_27175 [Bradyrhizobium sp. INPA01-394B]|uniref:Uncharacterized protein n=1 Tax=Bradyrhizobium campsiandrae TaxID=1729892 RepID=A0ABR7UEU8_9BRAD|nr:hypothetical protein [Bradyrhizobium campsiandrae]MBC9881014.1 hypothetical protein [Bradyrhizobium campsiandrae]MBC9981942.1 hypothetical protein [Bradyrhizobium campsiandrae]